MRAPGWRSPRRHGEADRGLGGRPYTRTVPVLEIPGAFAMLIDEGWSATRTDNLIELNRSDGDDSALHLSTYVRKRRAIEDDEAQRAVKSILDVVRPTSADPIVVLRESRRQHRAVTRIRARADGEDLELLVFVVVWPTRLVRCTCTTSPGSPVLDEAEQAFASIHPVRRRWLRRR